MLAEEMANARLIEANSLIELRVRPARLTDEIAVFLDEVWGERPARKRPSGARAKRPAKRARARS
jgi:hypothetical protein